MKRAYICFCLIVLVLGCREPFEGFDYVGSGTKLVIEAIVTDTGADGYVRISYAEPINGEALADYETEDAAMVTLTDDQGNEVILHSQGNGAYGNSSFKAVFGRNYQLNVSVGNNRYRSDWQMLAQESTIPVESVYRPDTISVLNDLGNEVRQLAVTISDKITRQDKDIHYYWQVNYFYIYDAFGQPEVLHLLPEAKRFCYLEEHLTPELIIHTDRYIEGLSVSDYRWDLTTIPFGRKMVYDYSIQVIRYSISPGVNEYFERIKNQISNVGGIFDASPSTIVGNIEKVSGDLDVLGFFGVFNVSTQRLFFNQDELPYNKLSLPTGAGACPGHHAVNLDNTCFNCTAVAAPFNSVTKPTWWR